MSKGIFVCFMLILATLASSGIGPAQITYVEGATVIYVPDDYSTIESAVNHANAGDTIIVRDGNYTENVKVNKVLTIMSKKGPTNCYVEATNPFDNVFEVNANNVTISGFTVEGANPTTTSPPIAGIYIQANNTMIKNNILLNNSVYGIYLKNSFNNVIDNNKNVKFAYYFIYLRNSFNNVIANNTISKSYGYGIYLVSSSNNSIESNNITKYSKGIYLSSSLPTDFYVGPSNNNVIVNNTISKNIYGIRLISSSNNVMRNNTISENRYNFGVSGSELSHFIQNIDTSNTVDGKQIYYLLNETNAQIPSDAGYVGIVNSSNIIVENLTLTNNQEGVLLAYSKNCRIENVITSKNNHGIYLKSSTNNTIENNNASENWYSFYLVSSTYNTIKSNNASFNSASSIIMWSSSNNIIANNTMSNNDGGFSLYSSNNNIIANNTVSTNKNLGIWQYDSKNNWIYLNNFINNSNSYSSYISLNNWRSPSVFSYVYNGSTYHSYLGNYWSDYEGNDMDGDGIGDTPYGKDYYPLMIRFENYFEVFPPETTILIGSPRYDQGENIFVNFDTNITLEATDEGVGVYYSSFKIDDGQWMNYSSPFNLSGYIDGEHVIYYFSVDKTGNLETMKNMTVIIDNTSPSTTHIPDEGIYSEIITITLTAVDDGCGVNETHYKIGDDGEWIKYIEPVSITEQGIYTIYYYSIDNLGNREIIKSVTYTVDKTSPTISVSIAPPNPYITQKVSFIVTVNDNINGTGIANSTLYIDGNVAETWRTAGTHAYTGGPYTQGTHTYYLEATDNAGNKAREPAAGGNTFTVSFPWKWVALVIVAVIATAALILALRRRRT